MTSVLGDPNQPPTDVNSVTNETQNVTAGTEQPTPETAANDALRKQAAKAAAAEARLIALQKAQAKAAQQAKAASTQKPGASPTTSTAQTDAVGSESSSSGGPSRAKLSQFYSIVDDARSMAKRVMKSGNAQNASLARSYDANLNTLRDSGRGITSDREADRLIAQAKQTRAYVQFLVKQSQ